jgi:hypothetical protein
MEKKRKECDIQDSGIATAYAHFKHPAIATLKQLGPQDWLLELFHGPTLAFKDVGARFMSRCLGYFFQSHPKKVTVLVATSGDTGGAVASGFLGVGGVEVVILYPKGKVSPVQELQLTTCGQNITALAVEGSFDDCQFMVKEAFMDADLQKHRQLIETRTGKPLQPEVRKILAQRFWAFGRGILREGHITEAQEYFAAARDLDPKNCIIGNKPYPLLVKFLGPFQAEFFLDQLRKLKATMVISSNIV